MLIPYQFVDKEDARKVAADLAQWREPIQKIEDFPSPDGWRYAVVEVELISKWSVARVRAYQIQVSNEKDKVIGFWGHALGEVEA